MVQFWRHILQLTALLNLFTFIKWQFAGRSAVVQIKNTLHKTSFSLTVTIIPFYSKFFKLERSGLPKVLIKGLLSPNHNQQIYNNIFRLCSSLKWKFINHLVYRPDWKFWAFEYENAICVQSKWYVTICYFFLENLLYISPPYMSLIYEKLHVLVNLWVIKFTKFGCWNKFSSWSLIDTSKKYDFILDSLMSFSHYLLGHVCALLSIHVRQCTQK